jgi:hypothetical protein
LTNAVLNTYSDYPARRAARLHTASGRGDDDLANSPAEARRTPNERVSLLVTDVLTRVEAASNELNLDTERCATDD